jgi:hypothetical protein
MNIIQSIHDKRLFRPLFKDLSTWAAWLVILKATFALDMTEDELEVFYQLAGNRRPPDKPVKTLVVVAGRRSGKSFVLSLLTVFLGLFYSYRKHLTVGERAKIVLTAADKPQAKVDFNYCHGILHSSPVFEQYVVKSLSDRIELSTQVDIEVKAADYRSIRGPAFAAVLCDEISFWPSDPHSARPDMEFLEAVEPGMLTIPNSMLVIGSSPYARRGALWHYHENFYGQSSDEVLVIQAPSILLNPTLDQAYIERKIAASVAARSEYLATWREDIESFLSYDAIQAVVGPHAELVPDIHTAYKAAVDVSGGRHDSFALSIAHHTGEKVVVDLVKCWQPPLDPLTVVKEIAEVCERFRITSITGDRYAAEWSKTAFESEGMFYKTADLAKSDLYLNLEPVINTQNIILPNNERLIVELQNLERRTGRNKDVVDHPPHRGATDDSANSVALVAYELRGQPITDARVDVLKSSSALEMESWPGAQDRNYSDFIYALTDRRLNKHGDW